MSLWRTTRLCRNSARSWASSSITHGRYVDPEGPLRTQGAGRFYRVADGLRSQPANGLYVGMNGTLGYKSGVHAIVRTGKSP